MVRPRLLLLAFAALSLVFGAWTGLARLGVLSGPGSSAVAAHGALMVGGLFGTLVSLERAVALGRAWAYSAPLAAGLSAILAIAGAPWALVTGGFVLAGALFSLASLWVALRHPASYTAVMAAGAVAWLAGNVAWHFGEPVYRVAPLWMAFLVLTIVGERIELSRMVRPGRAATALVVAVAFAYFGAALLGFALPDVGARLGGAFLVGLALWFSRHDVARRTVRTTALPRYVAVCLLAGYFWLAVAGSMLLVRGPALAGPHYDAVLHAVFLGFVMSMVFGHAPVILPAVLGISLPYRPILFAPLLLLHASVFLRVGADLAALPAALRLGAILNVVALAAFAASAIACRLGAGPSAAEPGVAAS